MVRVVTVSLDNMHSDYIPFYMVLTVKKNRDKMRCPPCDDVAYFVPYTLERWAAFCSFRQNR